jgi:hypothetical protein
MHVFQNFCNKGKMFFPPPDFFLSIYFPLSPIQEGTMKSALVGVSTDASHTVCKDGPSRFGRGCGNIFLERGECCEQVFLTKGSSSLLKRGVEEGDSKISNLRIVEVLVGASQPDASSPPPRNYQPQQGVRKYGGYVVQLSPNRWKTS